MVRPRAVERARRGEPARRRAARGRSAAAASASVELCLAARAGRPRGRAGARAGATLVLGALPIARVRQRRAAAQRWLPRRRRAARRSSPRRSSSAGGDDPRRPTTRAVRDGAGWRLDGVEDLRPRGAPRGARSSCPRARGDGRSASSWSTRSAPACTLERQVATNREPQSRAHARRRARRSRRRARRSGARARDRRVAGRARASLGLCAIAARRRRARAAHDREVHRPSASSSTGRSAASRPCTQRAADAYIDVEAIRLTDLAGRLAARRRAAGARRGARWRSSGPPTAGTASTYAAQHLHGGIGVDVDYPLHRYYLWAKHDRADARLGGAAPRRWAKRSRPGPRGWRAPAIDRDEAHGPPLPHHARAATRIALSPAAFASAAWRRSPVTLSQVAGRYRARGVRAPGCTRRSHRYGFLPGDDLVRRAMAVDHAFLALGHETLRGGGRALRPRPQPPGIHDANYVSGRHRGDAGPRSSACSCASTGSSAALRHRQFLLDAQTPPGGRGGPAAPVRLRALGHPGSFLLEGDLRAGPRRMTFARWRSEEDWAAYGRLKRRDWDERAARLGFA